MTILVNGTAHELADGTTLAAAVRALSPYGDDPVAVLCNGARRESGEETPLGEEDDLRIYPLLIGG